MRNMYFKISFHKNVIFVSVGACASEANKLDGYVDDDDDDNNRCARLQRQRCNNFKIYCNCNRILFCERFVVCHSHTSCQCLDLDAWASLVFPPSIASLIFSASQWGVRVRTNTDWIPVAMLDWMMAIINDLLGEKKKNTHFALMPFKYHDILSQ